MSPREIDLEFHRAVAAGDKIDVIRDLLGRKANPNAPFEGARAPLALAVERDELVLCRLLLAYQADPSLPELSAPLQQSGAASESSESAALVSSWASGDAPAVLGSLEELVRDGAASHDLPLLGLALASVDIAGGDAEQCAAQLDASRNSLLHACAAATAKATDARGEAAARLTARALLGWGVPADARNAADETPLLLALRGMHTARASTASGASFVPREPARALLEARADVETVDPKSRDTLLMQAAKEGNLAACELLLEFDADPLRLNPLGKNAINLAIDKPEVVLMLRSALVRRGFSEPEPPSCGAFDGSPVANSASGDGSIIKRRTSEFTISELDQEVCSAEGLLNQVDLEESYDVDWNLEPLHTAASEVIVES